MFAIEKNECLRASLHFQRRQKNRTGLNFTNNLWAAFTHADPKSTKRQWWLDCLMCFWDLHM